MAHITATIMPRETLGFRTRVEVIIPQDTLEDFVVPDKVLYLLHGLGGDATAWCRNTRIEYFAERRGYIVIMPEVQRSFYFDMKYGSKYFSYLTKELPRICEELFNFKHERAKTFVAGLSMGGYGALKCGFTRPDFYAACAGFSGALDPEGIMHDMKDLDYPEIYAIMDRGDPFPEDANLFLLSEKMAKLPKEQQARVLVTCGDQDYLLGYNWKFDKHMKNLPVSYEYKEWEGEHDWPFWEECLPVMFEFFERDL